MSQTSWYVSGHLQEVSRCLQQNPGGIIGCHEPCGMCLDVSSRSPGVTSSIQEVSLHVANLVVCCWMSPAGLNHLQQNPGDIIGCREHCGISLDISCRSPGVSSRNQEVSWDVVNGDICLAKAPASLQVSPAESRRYHWMSQTSWYVTGYLQQVSRCLQWNPGGIIGCSQHSCMSGEGSSESPGASSRIQEVSSDVTNLVVCLCTSPGGLQVSLADSSRYHWVSPTLWYVSGCLQQVSRHLQQNPGGVIGFPEHRGMSLDICSTSPGVSSGIQKVSLDVANIDVCGAKAPASLQVCQQNPGGIIGCSKCQGVSLDISSRSPGPSSESRRDHSMSRSSWYVTGCLQQVSRCLQQNADVSLDVANLVVCLWRSPAGLQVAPAECSRYHWMLRTLWWIFGCLQQVSRCLQGKPGGIIGCSEDQHISCKGSSEFPGVSRRIQQVSLDVTNLVVCLWMSPAGLQVSPSESRRDHWIS